jgi:predicted AAA+ superfamily ATPase
MSNSYESSIPSVTGVVGTIRRAPQFNSASLAEATPPKTSMASGKKRSAKRADKVLDLTRQHQDSAFGITKEYNLPYEWPLAQFAVTDMVNSYGHMVRDMKNISQTPTSNTINTDVNEKTVVYEDVYAKLVLPDGNVTGALQAVFIQSTGTYRVVLCAESKAELAVLESVFEEKMEMHNFYQGKTLRFSRDGVVFINTPSTTMDDVILPQKTKDEHQLNVIDFLTDPKYSENIKKRSLLYYGPPGTGKTSMVKASFNELRKAGVTCLWVSDDTFRKVSVESVFSFINSYLAPAFVVFEDLDLIAADRRTATSAIIGPLLSALNGISDQEKPIVIVGTTNRPEILDEAVTRPCRFDRKIKIGFPTSEALASMFEQKAGFKPDAGSFNQPSEDKKKLTGAHIEEICNTAELLSKKNNLSMRECVQEAVQVIKENFYLIQPGKVGFSDSDGDDPSPETQEAPSQLLSTKETSTPESSEFFR